MGTYKKENRFCCPKHAPLKKEIRGSKLFWTIIVVNTIIQVSYCSIQWDIYTNKIFELHQIMLIVFLILFAISMLLASIVRFKNPGHTEKMDKNKLCEILDQRIESG